MIGYYVHHHGLGHLHRARAIVAALDEPVTGLSSLPRPADWTGEWIELERDDAPPVADETAGGTLHWVPTRHAGLRTRMSQVSRWIADVDPAALVADVSVEVAALARLHGVPVVTVAMPGRRGDAAHRLGYALSDAVVAAWPPGGSLVHGVDDVLSGRLHEVGAISRFAPRSSYAETRRGHATLMLGRGGSDVTPADVERIVSSTDRWTWTVLGAGDGTWTADPWPELVTSEVVVTHAGQNAVAEVAAARRPAVVVPQERPFDEQRATAEELARDRWPALTFDALPRDGWDEILDAAAELDGSRWAGWCDGEAALRAAAVIRDVATVGADHA